MASPQPANRFDSAPSGEKIAFATVLSDDYVPGFAVLIHTLRKHNPGFTFPFHIFHCATSAPLSEESRAVVQAIYPEARIQQIDEANYEPLQTDAKSHRSRAELLLIEAFSLTGYSRVVVCHADLVCLGSVEELLRAPADLAAVCNSDNSGSISTGVMVLGSSLLRGDVYRGLLAHRLSGDLAPALAFILTDYLVNVSPYSLSPLHNSSKRKFPDSSIEVIEDVIATGVTLLHFQGGKPWHRHASPEESRFRILESYWLEELTEALQPLAYESSSAGLAAKAILARAISQSDLGLSRRSELELRDRIRSLEMRASSTEQKLRFAAGVIRRSTVMEDPKSLTEPSPELLKQIQQLEEDCSLARRQFTVVEKENAALARTIRALEEGQRKLRANLDKARQREAAHKALRKTHDALVSYSIKVAERLEGLAGQTLGWLFRSRFRRWADKLRKHAEERDEESLPSKESKPPTIESSTPRPSNPILDRLHPMAKTLLKKWQNLPEREMQEHWKAFRREGYLESGEFARLEKLANRHQGERCYILGDSSDHRELSIAKGDLIIATDRAAVQPNYVPASYYCISSPDIFGGWEDPRFEDALYLALQQNGRETVKLFPFAFRDYLRVAGLFRREFVYYALYEEPRDTVRGEADISFDFSHSLDNGPSTILTLAIPLAVHLGCSEIVLLAGTPEQQPLKSYFEATSKKLSNRGIKLTSAPV